MAEKTVRILGIAPYEGLRITMEQAAEAYPDIVLDTYTADLEDAVEILRSIPENTYDCIISRGGTATLLKKAAEIPVVEVPISMYDVLRVIKLAENYKKKYAIVGFPNITKPAHTLCDLLHYDIDIISVHDTKEVLPALKELQSKDYHMIISDMFAHTVAQSIGLDAFLITSGMESLNSAFDQALQYFTAFHRLTFENLIMRSICFQDATSIIVLDQDHRVDYAYPQQPERRLLEEIRRHIREIPQRGCLKFNFNDRGMFYTVSGQILNSGMFRYFVFHYSSARIPIRSEKNGLRSYSKSECEHAFMSSFYSISGVMGEIEQSVSSLAMSRMPLMISGENGTGKETIARAIYLRGPLSSKPFMVINCEVLNEKTWNFLVSHVDSPLNDQKLTIYFQHLESLSHAQIDTLTDLVQESLISRRIRLIFSCVSEDDEPLPEGCQSVVNRLGCLTLKLPTLRSRSDEIPSLASVYLGTLNLELGKQISGFEPKALEKLQEYSWPRNYTQFEQILSELATLCTSAYIRSDAAAEALAKERLLMRRKTKPKDSPETTQTLDEIIKDAIQNALDANGGNQTAAAKQLGISRTTLWRHFGQM